MFLIQITDIMAASHLIQIAILTAALCFGRGKKSPYLIPQIKQNPRFFLEPLDKASMGTAGSKLSSCQFLYQIKVSQQGQRLDISQQCATGAMSLGFLPSN